MLVDASDIQTARTAPGAVAWTAREDHDAGRALLCGIAEYLSGEAVSGGGEFRFAQASYEWAEPEDRADYPALVVHAGAADERYDVQGLTGDDVDPAQYPGLPIGMHLWTPALVYIDAITVEARCSSPETRSAAVALVQRAMVPRPNYWGVQLRLGRYHNAHASYSIESVRRDDDEMRSKQGLWIASFTLRGKVPLVRIVEVPYMKGRPALREVVLADQPFTGQPASEM